MACQSRDSTRSSGNVPVTSWYPSSHERVESRGQRGELGRAQASGCDKQARDEGKKEKIDDIIQSEATKPSRDLMLPSAARSSRVPPCVGYIATSIQLIVNPSWLLEGAFYPCFTITHFPCWTDCRRFVGVGG